MKKVKDKLTIVCVVVAAIFAVVMTFVNSGSFNKDFKGLSVDAASQKVFPQEVISVTTEPHQVFALYDKGNLVGYFSSKKVIDELFQQVYFERFREAFPGAEVGLGADAYLLQQTSYNVYDNIDEKLINYINDNELFAIEATKITFSNGVTCYVKDIKDFEAAKEKYLLNFINQKDYDRIKKNIVAPVLTGVGSQAVKLMVNQTATISKGFASPNRVLKDINDIVTFLGYGNSPSKVNYTVHKYDTVEGIAYRQGISINNLMTINSDKISSKNQLLDEGMVLNVAEFTSPIQVVVQEEVIEEEVVSPPGPKIIVDNSYPINYREVITEAKKGRQLSRYLTTFVNGVNYESKYIDKYVIEEPIQMVVKVGSYNSEETSGMFDWPVSRHHITCGYLCYPGHVAVDFQPNGYNSLNWPILSAADGVIVTNTFHFSYGYYVDVKHVGGYVTRYAHQIRKSSVTIGQTVSKGDVIGHIGNTGKSTGPHLHFEIRYNGRRLNPCLFLGC